MEADIVWKIVMRRGMDVTFACGHRQGRSAAYVCLASEGRAFFVRRVPRPLAPERPCHECVLETLRGRGPDGLAGFEGLVRIETGQKSRPD